MRILIFHYHLNPGGVTRIIESQVIGLKKMNPDNEIVVVAGACENVDFYEKNNVKIIVNPIINYLFDKNFTKNEILGLYDEIKNFISGVIAKDDILHVHNLNLGKNPILTKVFFDFMWNGYQLINHAHDFAEDRPANNEFMKKIFENFFEVGLQDAIYPNYYKYKIGVLNRFDYNRVMKYGINEENIFLLPNPVLVPGNLNTTKKECRNSLLKKFQIKPDESIITYPVRVIRRKNIGELILLATIFKGKCRFLVTLPPQNPVEIEFYSKWINFCNKNDIPIVFEAGKQANFEEILTGSDYCITTSIQEGFGMSYLEPWTFGTPVIGRNIESITVDLIEEGVEFPLLYNEIAVNYEHKWVDFKNLNYEEQRKLINQIKNDKESLNSIISRNSFLKNFPPGISKDLINKNKETISINFSVDSYADRLHKMYQ